MEKTLGRAPAVSRDPSSPHGSTQAASPTLLSSSLLLCLRSLPPAAQMTAPSASQWVLITGLGFPMVPLEGEVV